jgi:hypothetical protein
MIGGEKKKRKCERVRKRGKMCVYESREIMEEHFHNEVNRTREKTERGRERS